VALVACDGDDLAAISDSQGYVRFARSLLDGRPADAKMVAAWRPGPTSPPWTSNVGGPVNQGIGGRQAGRRSPAAAAA
jgi:hypothetical protein